MRKSLIFLITVFCVAITLNAQDINSPSVLADGHSYVDLGLSVMWATCNIGAQSPAGNGKDYAWGEIESKTVYSIDNSKTYNRKFNDISANPDYDVAAAEWGGLWRMPTAEEIKELTHNCWYERRMINGVEVCVVTGPNNNQIILPADSEGYWSSTPYEQSDSDTLGYYAHYLPVFGRLDYDRRDVGFAIRPVYGKRNITKQPENQTIAAWENKPSGTKDGREYVDLGLSVKWATCNVGGLTPFDEGDYYAWAQLTTNKNYDYRTYSYNGTWNEDISGNPEYDVVRATWGGGWRMPTKAEFEELASKCKRTMFSIGKYLYAKYVGPNGNSIILPGQYKMDGTEKIFMGDGAHYWTSTPSEYEDQSFYIVTSVDRNPVRSNLRYYGLLVRGVID